VKSFASCVHQVNSLTLAVYTIEVLLYPLSLAKDENYASEPVELNKERMVYQQTALSTLSIKDVPLTFETHQHCVATLPFGAMPPRRVELSPDKRLLLVIGVLWQNSLSLVV
jgi:hypothetical protein